jgi:prepilin peptidase dependent protein B
MLMAANSKKSQLGINLIELMVGIAISLILLGGVLTVMLQINTAGGETVQSARLNQQVRGAMELMTKELQRAGYVNAWTGNDISGDGVVNVLDVNLDAIKLFGFVTIAGGGNCILYSYDLNGDGFQGVGAGSAGSFQNSANFELFGFRLNAGAVEMKTSGAHSCANGGWTAITDNTVTISALTFDITYADESGTGNDATVYRMFIPDGDADYGTDPERADAEAKQTNVNACIAKVSEDVDGVPGSKCLVRRKVTIQLDGALSGDNAVVLSLANDVKIKNDHFIAIPD